MTKTLERIFEYVGEGVAKRPWTSCILSGLICVGIGSGFFTIYGDNIENRCARLICTCASLFSPGSGGGGGVG